nr:putative integron gene cassette protein [uncultured bacterium]
MERLVRPHRRLTLSPASPYAKHERPDASSDPRPQSDAKRSPDTTAPIPATANAQARNLASDCDSARLAVKEARTNIAALTRKNVVNMTLEMSELTVGPSQRKAATAPNTAVASNESNPAKSASVFVGERSRDFIREA